MAAIIPIGTLIRKVQRQSVTKPAIFAPSVNQPPSSGPITELIPKTAPNIPCHLPRSSTGNKSPIIVKAFAVIIPPPIPCNARQAINHSTPGLAPLKSEPIVNIATPDSSSGLRPYISLSLPAKGTVTVVVNIYAVTINPSDEKLLNSLTIAAKAVETIV